MTSFVDQPEIIMGHRVVVVPSFVPAPRSWNERLFSFPWRPFERMKLVSNPAAPSPGSLFVIGGIASALGTSMPTLFVREEDYGRLKRLMGRYGLNHQGPF